MDSVAVVVSTYNGEKFLREQIDSILCQKGVKLTVFVRDDGSSDSTKRILAEYRNAHDNVVVDFAENVGVGNSFMNALYKVPADFDYYALADQDDIWQENKLSEAIAKLKSSGKLLYGSNQECVDKAGSSMGLRYAEDAQINRDPIGILCTNMIAGCTMVFTNQFFRILTEEKHRPSAALLRNRIHDVWLAMVASLYDGIYYDQRSFMKYRQHENNLVGAKNSRIKALKERLKKARRPEFRNGRSFLAKEITEKFPQEADKFPLLAICSRTQTRKDKNKIIQNRRILTAYTKESSLAFRLKVRFGLF